MELTSESKLKNEKVNAGITLTSQIHKFQDFGSANANFADVGWFVTIVTVDLEEPIVGFL